MEAMHALTFRRRQANRQQQQRKQRWQTPNDSISSQLKGSDLAKNKDTGMGKGRGKSKGRGQPTGRGWAPDSNGGTSARDADVAPPQLLTTNWWPRMHRNSSEISQRTRDSHKLHLKGKPFWNIRPLLISQSFMLSQNKIHFLSLIRTKKYPKKVPQKYKFRFSLYFIISQTNKISNI